MTSGPGLHHYHKRKRIHVKHEPYPHPQRFKRFMDKTILGVGIIAPILSIPQITKIWMNKTAAGVSLIAWLTYLITAIFWLIYGVLHKDKPIIVTFGAWILIDFLVVIGILIYG